MKYKMKRKEEKGRKEKKKENEKDKRREREKKNENRFRFPFSFPSFSFSFDFSAHSGLFSWLESADAFFPPFFTSFVPFHLFERAAFCACTMTINIITFAVSRNLYRSPGEILLCSIIRREGKGGKASYARVEIKIVGAACFIPAKLAPQSVYSLRAGAHAFVPVFIRFLTWRQFSLRDHATNYRRFPLLMDGWLLFKSSCFDCWM